MKLKFLFVISLIFTTAYITKADEVGTCTIDTLPTDPNSPNGCWFEEEQIEYLPGDSWVSKGGDICARYTCKEAGVIGAVGCAQFVPSPGYQLTNGDNSKPYPDCCPQAVRRRKKLPSLL